MFFNHLYWEEEIIGLIAGLAIVLVGVFAYIQYLLSPTYLVMLFAVSSMVFAALSAVLFQLPRLEKVRPAMGTFLAGITIGLAVIFWVLCIASVKGELLYRIEVSTVSAILAILSFFAIGFILLALYPPLRIETKQAGQKMNGKKRKVSKNRKDRDKEININEDIIDRL